jgi:hypothetical protein
MTSLPNSRKEWCIFVVVTIGLGVVADAIWAAVAHLAPARVSVVIVTQIFYFVFIAAIGMLLGRYVTKRFGTQWKTVYEKANKDYLEANKDRTEFREKFAEASNDRNRLTTELDALQKAQKTLPAHPLPALCEKILLTCIELKVFLGEHGDKVKLSKVLGESVEQYNARINLPEPREARIKYVGDYRRRYRQTVIDLRDEIRQRCGISDHRLDDAIYCAEDFAGAADNLEEAVKLFWDIAFRVNC